MGKAQWLTGASPSSADCEAFNAMKGAPDGQAHPNALAWYLLVGLFSDDVKVAWEKSTLDKQLINDLRSGVSTAKPKAAKAAPPAGAKEVVTAGPPRNVGEMSEVLANIERMHFLLKTLKVD